MSFREYDSQLPVNAQTVQVKSAQISMSGTTNQAQGIDGNGMAKLHGDILRSWTDAADGFIFYHPFTFPRA
jgi:hypothetical protein